MNGFLKCQSKIIRQWFLMGKWSTLRLRQNDKNFLLQILLCMLWYGTIPYHIIPLLACEVLVVGVVKIDVVALFFLWEQTTKYPGSIWSTTSNTLVS